MSECYICGNKLSQNNKSIEHIFPNCLGGKLKSRSLLCSICNSHFGSEIDSHLCEEMRVISNLLNIKRERKTPRSIQGLGSDGHQYTIKPGLRIHRTIPVEPTPNGYDIIAKNRHQFNKILKNIKNKHPNIDEEEILKNAKEVDYFLDNIKVDFVVEDDEKTLRAICKIAVNFYLFNNGDIKYVKHLIPYLKGETDIECVWFYSADKNEIYDSGVSPEILHSVVLIGDDKEKILYAYIELFSTFKFIVKLNDDYDGLKITESYFFNVISHKTIEPVLKESKTKEDLTQISKDPLNFNNLRHDLNTLIRFIQIQHYRDVIAEMVSKVFTDWVSKHQGKIITDSEIAELINGFEKELKIVIPRIHKNSNNIKVFMKLFKEAIKTAFDLSVNPSL